MATDDVTEPFGAEGRVVKKWVVAVADEDTDWEGLPPYVRESHQAALKEG